MIKDKDNKWQGWVRDLIAAVAHSSSTLFAQSEDNENNKDDEDNYKDEDKFEEDKG